MDNSQFLSYFWDLSDTHTNDQILTAAEAIVTLVETKQKLENDKKDFNREKYRIYWNICENATEDILYTTKRLIGGIASTGVESKRGFTLTFALLVEKFSNLFNFNEIITIIERETLVSKGEKGHIKNCALTGKVLMLKTLLDVKTVGQETILNIFKILFDLLTTAKILEEAILQIINSFFKKLSEGFYLDMQENKKLNKFLDKFLNLLNKILINKSNFGNFKTLYEFSLIFILLANSEISGSILNFLHHSSKENIISENSLNNFFRLLISSNIRDNEFHSSFKFFLTFLSGLKDFPRVIGVWNILIDSQIQETLKTVSLKNFQFLIYSFSKYLLENYFVLKYVHQIFDSSYFDTIMKFNCNKKFKYVSSLVEILMSKMKNISEGMKEKEKDIASAYSFDLLKIFGGEFGLSPQTYKSFFAFLFNNLSEVLKEEYIDSLVKAKETTEEEEEEEFSDLKFRITALKQLMVSSETDLSKSLKTKILEFFFREYYAGEERNDVEVEDIIEDRLMLVVFSYMRIPKEQLSVETEETLPENEGDKVKPMKDKKMIKLLMQVHKFLQNLFMSKVIEDFEMNDYKVYNKFYKKFVALVNDLLKEKTSTEEEKTKNDKLFCIVKIALIALILYLKNPNEYSDVISDLYEVTSFKADWQKVYMDLLISLLHKGNNTLSEFIMNCFRKTCKYLDMESIEVLLGFLSSQQDKQAFEDFEDVDMVDAENFDDEAETKEEEVKTKTEEAKEAKATPKGKNTPSKKGNSSSKKNGSSKKMFDDLVDEEMA